MKFGKRFKEAQKAHLVYIDYKVRCLDLPSLALSFRRRHVFYKPMKHHRDELAHPILTVVRARLCDRR